MKTVFTCLLFFALFASNTNTQAQCFASIESGGHHTLVIKTDGTLWAWGYNASGQVGDGSESDRYYPVQIGTDTDWRMVSPHKSIQSFAIKTDGTLWAWGWNERGSLGDGTYVSKSSPVQIGTDNNWADVAAGLAYSIALKTDGTLWAWGWNEYGTLGDGTYVSKNSPVQIGTDHNWKSIHVGQQFSIATKTDGTLWAWGINYSGELGIGTTTNQSSPVQINGFDNWASLSIGYNHSLVLKTDGTLWAWGSNYAGQIGDGTVNHHFSPVQIGTNNDWVQISANGDFSYAIKSDGTLWRWGVNGNKQSVDDPNFLSPIQIGADHNWQNVSAGHYNVFGLKDDGTLWTWGDNFYGDFGDGTNESKIIPTHIPCPTTYTPSAITEQQPLVISPNPATQSIYFRLPQITEEVICIWDCFGTRIEPQKLDFTFDIINAVGQRVMAKQEGSNPLQINIEDFSPGIYFLRIKNGKENIVRSFMKM
jgi:alpha-tubulin suppressor-like RCC1 family protein